MPTKRKRGKYYLDSATILPEMIVTPKGNDYLTDELGNPAASMGALRDIDPNITVMINRQLHDNQYRIMPTNAEANSIADAHTEQTAPGISDMILGTVGKTMNLTSPVHWWGAVRDWDSSKGLMNIWEDNSGLVSKEYAEQHPWLSLGMNLAGDVIGGNILNGSLKVGKNAIRIGRNIKDRNKFAYAYIKPFSYDEPFKRFKTYASHIIRDKNFAKDEIPKSYLEREIDFNDVNDPDILQGIFRNLAFKKYLGLDDGSPLYLSNGDGTYRYNLKYIADMEKKYGIYPSDEYKFQVLNKDNDIYFDFLTGNGGNVTLRKVGDDISEMYDPWDLNPFRYLGDNLVNKLQKSVATKANDLYIKLYDSLYSPFKYKGLGYKYLGGRLLNKLRYEYEPSFITKGILKKLNSAFEVGPVIGGKPFIMRTPLKHKTVTDRLGYNRTIYDYKYGGTIKK